MTFAYYPGEGGGGVWEDLPYQNDSYLFKS